MEMRVGAHTPSRKPR